MKNIVRSKLFNVLCGLILIANCSFSSMALPQTNAKPGLEQVGTASADSVRAYRIAMKKMHRCGDDFECEDAFLKAAGVMEDALLSDLNRKTTISVRQINSNLKDWRVGDAQIKETERYELAPMEVKGQPYLLAASYYIFSAVRVYAKNAEGRYELKAHLEDSAENDYQLVGMRFVMISPKDGVFVTLFGTEHFDCLVWRFDGEKIVKLWTSIGLGMKYLRAVDGEVVFSKKDREVRYSWTNGSWAEHPPN
jgi:hypothetical protein